MEMVEKSLAGTGKAAAADQKIEQSQGIAGSSQALSRRAFFRTLAVSGAASAAVLTGVSESKADGTTPGQSTGGYRETQHVKTYYALARI